MKNLGRRKLELRESPRDSGKLPSDEDVKNETVQIKFRPGGSPVKRGRTGLELVGEYIRKQDQKRGERLERGGPYESLP